MRRLPGKAPLSQLLAQVDRMRRGETRCRLRSIVTIVVEGADRRGQERAWRAGCRAHLGKALLLEDPDANPFLARFYEEPAAAMRWRHNCFFLFQRVHQVGGLKQIDLFEGGTVADFILDKDPLFATLTLSDDELHLYQQIYSHLMPQATERPDLVIYLQASPAKLVRGACTSAA